MDTAELKKKLRKLKNQELRIRFHNKKNNMSSPLIWNQFFSTKDPSDKKVKFNLDKLAIMKHSERKEIFSSFFYCVYYQYYQENGLSYQSMYDPSLLEIFGLNTDATIEEIKERFRVLAKLYHPDNGGNTKDFIDIVETYDKLKSN